MAQPTLEQLQNLERKHSIQFSDLVSAIDFWHRSRDLQHITPASRAAYGQRLLPLIQKWQKRQNKIVSKTSAADFMKQYVPLHWWLLPDKFPMLLQMRNKLDRDANKTSGAAASIGFFPLIIWAIIAIVSAWTVTEVVDETNNTSEEQAELVDSTNKFCTDNNLTPEQCKNLLAEQTTATTDSGSGIGSLFKWLLVAGLGFAAIKYGIPALSGNGKKSS